MKFAIVGQGAIASLFAYDLRKHDAVLLTRRQQTKACSLRFPDNSVNALPQRIYPIAEQSANQSAELGSEKPDVIVIAVKSYHMPELTEQLQLWVGAKTVLVVVQNGMGGAQLLKQAFPDQTIIAGTTTDAVHLSGQFEYSVVARGRLQIGVFASNEFSDANSSQVLNTLCQAHPNASVANDIEQVLYRKLSVSAVINPLSAVYKLKNGELLSLKAEIATLIEEIEAVFDKLGIDISTSDIASDVKNVMQQTADNYSSMLQDINNGRQTEIDSILGFLLQHSQQKGLHSPTMQALYNQVKALEA